MPSESKLRHYLLIYTVIFVSISAGVGMVNYTVDPYNDFSNNKIGLYFSTERQAKSRIATYPHDAILIGSSRMAQVDPADLCRHRFYNASFSAAQPEEMFYYLERYAQKQKVVVIGLDFFMFNEIAYPFRPMTQWTSHLTPPLEYLFSLNVLRDSLRALWLSKSRNPEPLTADGKRGDIDYSLFAPELYMKSLREYEQAYYSRYQYSLRRLTYIEMISQLLKARGIQAIFLISPEQEHLIRLIKKHGLYPLFLQWRATLKERIPGLVDFSESKYTQHRYFQANDPGHYLPKVGAEFINSLLGCQGS